MNTRTISIIFLSIMILSIITPLTNIVASAAISASATTTNTVYKFYKNQTFFYYLDYNVTAANITVYINGSSVTSFTNVPPTAKINFTVNSTGYLLVNGTTYGSSALNIGDVYAIVFRIANDTYGTVDLGPYYYTYTPTNGQLSLDRKHYPAFNETVVHLVLDDWDKNWDPNATDSHLVNVTVKAYFLNGTEKSGWIILNFTEMGTNTSKFHNATTLQKLVESVPGLYVNPDYLNEISCFEVVYTDDESGSTSSWIFDVFYTLGTIDVSTPSFPDELTITVTDPDANLDSWAYDGVPIPHTMIDVFVYYKDPVTSVLRLIDVEYAEGELNETGENTSVFTYTFPVTFNATLEPNSTEDIYNGAVRPLSNRGFSTNDGHLFIVPGSWLVVEYYDYDPAAKALVLVANKTVYPKFYDTSLVVTYNGTDYTSDFSAPTPIWFTFNMRFNDTNLEDGQWDIVKDGPCPACPCYDWRLYEGNLSIIPVYSGFGTVNARLVGEIEILVNGAPVNMTKNITVSICRIGFGQFSVAFKDEFLRVVPFNISWLNPMPNYGDNLTIKWVDFIANKSSAITVTFPPAEISLTLDRSEYPILHSTETGSHNVVVHVTVKDTTSILSSFVTARVTVVPGAPTSCNLTRALFGPATITLTKVSEALFEGSVIIPVNETFLDATLLVEYVAGDGTYVNATAVFKPHDGKIYINENTAVVNGTITIVLEEPDRNLDSQAYDTYTTTLSVYVNNMIVRLVPVLLNETGPNTGVFKATVWLNDNVVYWVNLSQAPLTLSIANKLSVNYVDGITSRARWVPGTTICGPSGCILCSVDAAPDASGDSVKIEHHTAVMYIFKVDPTQGDITPNSTNTSIDITESKEVLPVDRIRVFIVDPDLVFLGAWQTSGNATREQAANNTLIVTLKATKDREERYLLETSYVPYNPGAASWVIPPKFFNRTDTFVTPLINIGPLGCCELAARACFVEVTGPGDVIVVKYTDDYAAGYKKETISSTLKVVAEPPTIKIWFTDENGKYIRNITFTPEDAEYKTVEGMLAVVYKVDTPVILEPGYYMTVKICDDDALALYDVVRTNAWGLLNPYIGYEPTLTIHTATDTTGVTKRAMELLVTTPPRHFLLQNFKFDNATVVFKKQDTLYLVFNDAFASAPPEIGTNLTLYKVIVEIPLGAKPPAYPVVPNETGIEFKTVEVVPGTVSYMLDIPVFINGTATIPQLTVIAVIMKDGSVYDIRWTTYYNLAPGTTTVSADLGTGLEPGNYTVKILFWESITSMKPLSETVIEYSLTIG